MTPELQRYYEERLSMMSTRAWRELMEDIERMKDSTNTINGIDDLRKLGLRQGEVGMMDWMLNLRSISEESYEELQRENAQGL